MPTRVTITGGQEILRRLQALGTAITREVSIEALTEGAEPIRDEAARLAPRGDAFPHLADNIVIGPVDPGAAGATVAVAIGVPKEFFYDFFWEYGTVKLSAQPFYRPALDSRGAEAIERIVAAYWRTLEGRP